MNWSAINDFIPILGAAVNLGLVLLVLKKESASLRRRVLISVILIAALSVALYWSDAPEISADGTWTRKKPPLVAYLGLWTMKVKAMMAAVGIAMLNRVSSLAMAPLFPVLILLCGAIGALMVTALFVSR